MAKKQRLDKVLSNLGYGSRAEIKRDCKKGLVQVNGKVENNPGLQVDTDKDTIVFDGETIQYREFVYIMLNKPDGYISATFDKYDPIVLDLIEPNLLVFEPFPVGRLDKDSEGLLLITNDGKLAHELLSPKKHVDKVYYIEYEGELVSDVKERFKEGIILEDNYKCLPASIELLNDNKAYVTISEGKFHQVKRMINMCNGEVTYLKRIEFGGLLLDSDLEEGEYRELSQEEVDLLKSY